MGSLLSAYGLARTGFSLSALDLIHAGLLPLARVFTRPELIPLVFGMSRLEPLLLALDFIHLGSSTTLQTFCRIDLFSSAYGTARLGLLPPVPDLVQLELSMLLHSSAHTAPPCRSMAWPILNCRHWPWISSTRVAHHFSGHFPASVSWCPSTAWYAWARRRPCPTWQRQG